MKDKISKAVNNIFKTNLGVKRSERIIVFTDGYNKEIKRLGKLFTKTGEKFVKEIKYIEYQTTHCHGVEPPEEIWAEAFGMNVYRKLKQERLIKPLLSKKITDNDVRKVKSIITSHRNEAVDIVIALSYFSTTHTRFRILLNRICGARYASMPLFDKKMLTGAMGVNWKKMVERTKYIAKKVNDCENIEIHTPNGTFLTLSKKNRKVMMDTGIITQAGSFSNLPAGEVFLAPREGISEGTLVLDWAPTRKLKNPVTLYIEKGTVLKVEGKEEYVIDLEKKLSEKKENRNIAEFGIGTNDKAKRPDNILESEKILGTIHIALGDNSSFGGNVSTSFHQDFVFFKPTIFLIFRSGSRKTLLQNGKLLKNV